MEIGVIHCSSCSPIPFRRFVKVNYKGHATSGRSFRSDPAIGRGHKNVGRKFIKVFSCPCCEKGVQ